jgi:hypothetical protein
MSGPLRYPGPDQFAYGDLYEEGQPVRTTIHGTRNVNIEVGPDGKVVSVWFRCMLVPFDVDFVDTRRAAEMRDAYTRDGVLPVDAIIFHKAEGEHGE